MRLGIIGGGAAGFFAAIRAKSLAPQCEVVLLEASGKLLSKVRISGGGRCNVTHACYDPAELITNYPRGSKALRQAFSRFMTGDTIDWFESRGVPLKTEQDGRIFPVSDQSSSIVNCLMREAAVCGVKLMTHTAVASIRNSANGFIIIDKSANEMHFDRVLVATGGMPIASRFSWLKEMGHSISNPVPSLFTFNLPGNSITSLMGLSVKDAQVKLLPDGPVSEGPLLITHWGMSGPAVLKLSSLAARKMAEADYHVKAEINWCAATDPDQTFDWFYACRLESGKSRVRNTSPHPLPKRLWEYLVGYAGIDEEINWSDLNKLRQEKLLNAVHQFEIEVNGKTTFKEEFVTCGGINLNEVYFKTMESKIVPGLYFAGEVLDIDGLTGGFNFQSAWTTGYIAGTAMAQTN